MLITPIRHASCIMVSCVTAFSSDWFKTIFIIPDDTSVHISPKFGSCQSLIPPKQRVEFDCFVFATVTLSVADQLCIGICLDWTFLYHNTLHTILWRFISGLDNHSVLVESPHLRRSVSHLQLGDHEGVNRR